MDLSVGGKKRKRAFRGGFFDSDSDDEDAYFFPSEAKQARASTFTVTSALSGANALVASDTAMFPLQSTTSADVGSFQRAAERAQLAPAAPSGADANSYPVSGVVTTINVTSVSHEDGSDRFIKERDVVFFFCPRNEDEEAAKKARHKLALAYKNDAAALVLANYENALDWTRRKVVAARRSNTEKGKSKGDDGYMDEEVQLLDNWHPLGVVRAIVVPSGGLRIFTVAVRGIVEVNNVWAPEVTRLSVAGFCSYESTERLKDAGIKEEDIPVPQPAFPSLRETRALQVLGRTFLAADNKASLTPHLETLSLIHGPIDSVVSTETPAKDAMERVRNPDTFVYVGKILGVQPDIVPAIKANTLLKNKLHGDGQSWTTSYSGTVTMRVNMGLRLAEHLL